MTPKDAADDPAGTASQEPSRYARRRREILDAAAEIFRRQGYNGTTFGDIAAAVGTDRASMYYYVEGKEEILEVLIDEAVRRNLLAAEAIRDGRGTPAEKLRQMMESLMLSYSEYFPAAYLLIQENLNEVDPKRRGWASEMRDVNRAYMRVLIEVIEAGQADGTLTDSSPPRLVAYGIIGMLGWTHRWFNPEDAEFDAELIGNTFATTVLDGLAV